MMHLHSQKCGPSGLAFLATFLTTAGLQGAVALEHVWTHDAGGPARAEIVAYDAVAEEFLVVNGAQRCVTRLAARTGGELGRLDVSAIGDPTSVAAGHSLVAVAVVAPRSTDPGHVVFFHSAGSHRDDTAANGARPIAAVRVGAMPDMVAFTPDGRFVLSANEGEPAEDYRVDPEGSVSVIDVGRGAERSVALTADFVAFNARRDELRRQGVRIVGPNPYAAGGRASVVQDLEPEYIAIAPDSRTAWITLQENNALAVVDIRTATVTRIIGLGWKDHSRPGHGLDASDRDSGVRIRPWPVWGMYQPDGIATYDADGATYLVTANEGDARGYAGFTDEARVNALKLDASLLESDSAIQSDDRLGRLKVSRVDGDTDGDGNVERLLTFGARSIAIWTADGELVYDSGDALEQFIARHHPERFNIDGDGGNVDKRSPDKGPEPEGVVVGRVGRSVVAFVGLERTSAIAMFDVTRPHSAKLLDVVPLSFDSDTDGGPHVAPEGLAFVPGEASPLGDPLLAVACEVTGTTILFRVRESR